MPSQDHSRPKYFDGVQLGTDDVIFGIQIIGSDASTSPTTPRAISARATGTARPLDVAIVDSSGAQISTFPITPNSSINVAQFGGTAVSIGQQLASASIPVILPSATITTLTPPAAITGFALAATQTDKSQFTKITDGTDTALVTTAGNLNIDITTIAGTAPTTIGKLDMKGADGDVFVRQATAANLNAAVVGTGTAGSPSGNILTVQGVANMTKLLVTPDSVALPANQSVNVSQINGVTPLMGSGNTGTGSHRVTLATDQVALTTAGVFSVKVDQTTVGTTNAVSLAQLGANTVATGNGASSTGVLRVAQVNDGTGVIATVSTVTNLAQMNGATLLMGNGVTGTGSQRVTIASDNTPFAVKTDQTTHGTTDLVADDITKWGGITLTVAAALTDAATNPTSPLIGDLLHTYNGSTWDRARSVVTSQDTTGTGILAIGGLAQLDDENINTVTEDRFAPMRMSVRRALLSEGVRFGTPQAIFDRDASITIDTENVPPISIDGTVIASQDRPWATMPQDSLGNRLALPYANPVDLLDGTASATGTANTSIISAPPDLTARIYVTSIVIANSSATNTICNIKDGTVTKAVYPAPANSGAIHQLVTPLRLSPGNALQFAAGGAVATMYVSALGYRSVL